MRGEAHHRVEYVLDGDEADVLVGDWPEPLEDGSLPPDERRRVAVRVTRSVDGVVAVELDGIRQSVEVVFDGDTAHVHSSAGGQTMTLAPRFVDHSAETAGSGPLCPLPGRVIAVHVEVGQVVADGEVLVVVEAMKMEHRITSVGSSTVEEVLFGVGDRVDSGDLLVRLRSVDE
jgi:propionyl-CoA carboxylase alpha chain